MALPAISTELPLIFPIHPRTVSRIREFGFEDRSHLMETAERLSEASRGIYYIESQGYFDFLCFMANARLVLTDSSGIQEETTVLWVPCVTLRKNAERPVTIADGTNVLAGTDSREIARLGKWQLAVR